MSLQKRKSRQRTEPHPEPKPGVQNPDRAQLNKDATHGGTDKWLFAGRVSPHKEDVSKSRQLQELTPCCLNILEASTQPWTSVSPTIRGGELQSDDTL